MPYEYIAPLQDMRFVIEHVLEAPRSWAACETFAGLDGNTAAAVLEEAAKFSSQVLQPLSARGDREGCTLDTAGNVKTPRGFAAAYRAYVAGGWPALPCEPAWGGQGLPLLLDAAQREMLSACNHGWNMYPDLLHGAYETLKAHGSEALKGRYLGKLATGEWLAAMALTEPEAGSDLGALRTRALPQPDGSLAITGSKIFISGADHDLTPNIVHLVLVRLPEAPPGSKGLSLALVPKFLPNGTRNAWRVTGLEHKMGIHGSATCALSYEGATGWLVGEPHRGLAAMFLMMNSARLHVGLQGLGHQEMAAQNALRHAAVRVQFKMPISQMPAIGQALQRMQALTEAQRVIAYRAALAIDEAHHHTDLVRRDAAATLAALLTPVVKAWCTQQGFQTASAALQVYGGYGYVRETGIEQTLRDARIAMIYEGTNEIQAIDLLQRKVLADGGRALAGLLAECEAEAAAAALATAGATTCAAAGSARGEVGSSLRGLIEATRSTTAKLAEAARTDPQAALRAADEYLAGTAHLLLMWACLASLRAAEALPESDWRSGKVERMRRCAAWLSPQAAVHWQRAAAAAVA